MLSHYFHTIHTSEKNNSQYNCRRKKEKNIKETVVYPFISKARDLSYGENKIIIYTQKYKIN